MSLERINPGLVFPSLPTDEKGVDDWSCSTWKQIHGYLFARADKNTLYLFNARKKCLEIIKYAEPILDIETFGSSSFGVKLSKKMQIFVWKEEQRPSIQHSIDFHRELQKDDKFKQITSSSFIWVNKTLNELNIIDAARNKISKKNLPFECTVDKIHVLDEQHILLIFTKVYDCGSFPSIEDNIYSSSWLNNTNFNSSSLSSSPCTLIVNLAQSDFSEGSEINTFGVCKDTLYDFKDCLQSSYFVLESIPKPAFINLSVFNFKDKQFILEKTIERHFKRADAHAFCKVAPSGLVFFTNPDNQLWVFNPYIEHSFSLGRELSGDLLFLEDHKFGILKKENNQLILEFIELNDPRLEITCPHTLVAEVKKAIPALPKGICKMIGSYTHSFFATHAHFNNELERLLHALQRLINGFKPGDLKESDMNADQKQALKDQHQAKVDYSALISLKNYLSANQDSFGTICGFIYKDYPTISQSVRSFMNEYLKLQPFEVPIQENTSRLC